MRTWLTISSLVFLPAPSASAATFLTQGSLDGAAIVYISGNGMGGLDRKSRVAVPVGNVSYHATVNTETFEIHLASFSHSAGEIASARHLDGPVDSTVNLLRGYHPTVTETGPPGCGQTIFHPPCNTTTTGGQHAGEIGTVNGWTTSTDFHPVESSDLTGITLSIDSSTGLTPSVPILETLGVAGAMTMSVYTDATSGVASEVQFLHPDVSEPLTLLALAFDCGATVDGPFCDPVWILEDLAVVRSVDPQPSDYVPFIDHPLGEDLTGLYFKFPVSQTYRSYSALYVIPEPSTLILVSSGIVGLLLRRQTRSARNDRPRLLL